MDDHDLQIARWSAETADAGNEAADWLDRNKVEIGPKAHQLCRELLRRAESARNFERAARGPVNVALFGPSQTGKSYLLSAIGRKAPHPLIAILGNKEKNFLKDINPERKDEATGLVTRFGIDPTGATDSHPVAVRLFSQIDLVMMLANSFFLDFKPSSECEPSAESIDHALTAAQARTVATPVDRLTAMQIDRLRQYCDG